MSDMEAEINSGDMRRSLIAIRDYIVHELSDNRCHTCQMSKLKTGDTAALLLRLEKVLQAIADLPVPGEELDGVQKVQARELAESNVIPLGTKHAPRQQGGRRFSNLK